jgi:cytochrome c peroxidase
LSKFPKTVFPVFLVVFCMVLFSCGNNIKPYDLAIPEGWPEPIIPADKKLTQARVLLGRKLFSDPILSAHGDMSCATCHNPRLAFADSVPFSGSYDAELKRNTPTLFNVAWYRHFFMEGGIPTLELVAAVPIQSKTEMGFNLGDAVRKLSADEEYVKLFESAYDTLPSTYTLVRALSAFQRTLISGNSPYDQFILGHSSAVSESSRRGMELFFSERLGCSTCHSGFLFTDFGFHNIGLPNSEDVGRFRLTSIPSDSGKFKTPTLRNIAVTAPYMHDGSIKTLAEVVDFYSKGEVNRNGSERIKPFTVTPQEKLDLISFLQSLTDSAALSNPDFLPLK